MRLLACIALCAACASTPPDGGNAQSGVALIQAVQSPSGSGPTVAVSIRPTRANDLLYISVVYAGPSYPSPRVSTAAGPAEPLDWTTMVSCPATTYDWIVRSASPGATAVTLDVPGGVASQVFVLELSGVSREVEAASDAMATGADSTALAAQIDAAPGQVVISTISTCATVTSIAAGSPFVTFGDSPLGDVAYLLPAAAGSYGAAWMLDGAGWQARTTSFE
jgi:hypothetical protein